MSTGKSGSNWLDRLRSSKGFPIDHDQNHNLEHFLHNPNFSDDAQVPGAGNDPIANPDPTRPQNSDLNRSQAPEIMPSENGDRDWFRIMSNVLSGLFFMGDYDNVPQKKGFRKQKNPKICSTSISPIFQTEIAPPPPANLDSVVKENGEREVLANGGALAGEEEEDTGRADLAGFSRTEVTVIDTSCGPWKSERMLFRRKHVWKVRDKKCKGVINIGKKKRKSSDLLSGDSSGNGKKLKLSLGKSSSLNVPATEGLHQNDRVEEASKEGSDTASQLPKMRFPRKLKKGSSSVIPVKSIPPTKKRDCKCLPKTTQKLL